jgi:hypothetical protein
MQHPVKKIATPPFTNDVDGAILLLPCRRGRHDKGFSDIMVPTTAERDDRNSRERC